MKNKLLFLILISFLYSFTGCSQTDAVDTESILNTEVKTAVFDGRAAAMDNMLSPMLMEDNLYYWKGDWDNNSCRWSNTSIYCKAGGETEAVEIAALGDKQLLYFTVDEEQNLYYLYAESLEEKSLFLKKVASDGSTNYDVSVPEETAVQLLYEIEQNGYISQGTVSCLGRVIFRSPSGNLYLFDEKGEFLCVCGDGWEGEMYRSGNKGLANAGDDGIFTYAVMDNKILLSEVNMTNAALGTVTEVTVDTEISLDIFSGYDRGILISDGTSLWEYALTEEEMNLLLGWGDTDVELKGYDISGISMLADGRLYVMVTRQNGQNMELVYIETRSSSDMAEKQTIIIGSYETLFDGEMSGLAIMAEEFNKYNQQFQIELKQYESYQDLYMELLRGEGPDGFQLLQESVLASKGVLEDLSPYFAESKAVQETDLLPSVRNAGYKDGRLLYLFTRFNLRGLITGLGTTDNGVWTPEEYLGLGEQYPESLLTPQIGTYMVMQYALYADMESFLDRQSRECFFDSERFVDLLKSIRQVTNGKQSADVFEWRTNACRWLHDGVTLTEAFRISDVRGYVEYRDAYEEFAEFAGYPNSTGRPYYLFEPDYVLAMNSASANKEGVWAFMEFLLSEEYQSSVQGFPVRQDVFDTYVEKQFEEWQRRTEYNSSANDMNNISLEPWTEYPKVTEKDRDFLLYMVENAYWDETFDEIMLIISEETGSFWSGDKTAEEVAKIIQNRVKLYLDEL